MAKKTRGSLEREFVTDILPGPTTPISDSWFGNGYTQHLGGQDSPVTVTVYPKGRVVGIHSASFHGEIGPIMPHGVSRRGNNLRVVAGNDGEQVAMEISPNGDVHLDRNPRKPSRRIASNNSTSSSQ